MLAVLCRPVVVDVAAVESVAPFLGGNVLRVLIVWLINYGVLSFVVLHYQPFLVLRSPTCYL